MSRSISFALTAAALFGASTPLAKALGAGVSPFLTAGLLYLGSGLGLALARLVRDRGWTPAGLSAREWPWLLSAILFGGVLGPLALMVGLRTANAATASLLLNLEAVLTAVMAWLVFRENADRRVVLGMVAIVAGGGVLAWADAGAAAWGWAGASGVALACLCWAIDNNLTRKVSASDALFIAACKGLMAGSVNTALALGQGVSWPTGSVVLSTMLVGLLGYGVSLVLFVLALRGLGTARTGAYFSTAPFLGALVAIVFWGEPTTGAFWLAAVLMGLGVVLHLSERHEHAHSHEPMEHTHPHTHDAHHQHDHDFAWNGVEPHAHAHRHVSVRHSHPHYPDIHHQHSH